MAKQAWEVSAKDSFLRFLRERHGQNYAVTQEDVVVDPLTGRNYDYDLTPAIGELPVVALEIFRLVEDELDLGRHSTWVDITTRLRDALKARGVAGYYIRTPHFFIPKWKRNQYVAEAAERLATAIAASPDQEQLTIGEFTLYKQSGEARIAFSYIGGVRAINPFGSVSEALDALIPRKNDQLNVQGRLRTLLIVNAGFFQEEYDLRYYFSTKDIEQFPNVDRVFFEVAPGNIVLIFDRRAFDCYRTGVLPDEEELTGQLLSLIQCRLSTDQKWAFEIVKKVQSKYGDVNRLSVAGKDALISCGDKFAEEAEWDSVLWIIEQLKNDENPPYPNTMHERIARGESYNVITSVRGRLCWLMQKVVIQNLIDHYSYILNILKHYVTGPDFYIRSQACVPLSEMARRRLSLLPDNKPFMPEELKNGVRDTALRILRDAGDNSALLAAASFVLQWLKDLTDGEAEEVIHRLSASDKRDAVHNRCALLLYFAFFRDHHFRNGPPFNCERFRERLHSELHDDNPIFRAALMWQIAGLVESGVLDYDTTHSCLKSCVSGSYDNDSFLHLRRICEVHVKTHPEDVCPVILEAMEKIAQYIIEAPGPRAWNAYELDEYFDLLSEHCNEECVLDGVNLLLGYGLRSFFATKLTTVLSRYESPRASELRALCTGD